MTPKRYARIRATLDRRQPDLTVITEHVHKPHNVAAIVRTCDAVGVHAIHCVDPQGHFRAAKGTALGSQKWVVTHRHTQTDAALAAVRAQGMTVYAAHLSERAVNYLDIDYTQPIAILMGQERDGVLADTAEKVDGHVIIPMQGMVESFNVSVATAIILAEAQRQRLAAGLYTKPRLPADEYARCLFEWGHPVLARYCQRHRLPYPPLGEDGDVVDAAAWMARVRSASAE